MPSTFIGLIILIAFLVPGFIAIIVVRRKVPLFAARQSQLDIVLWGSLFSIISHILLLLFIITPIVLLICIFNCEIRETIYHLSDSKLSEISQNFNDIKIGYLLLSSLVCSIIDSILAFFLGVFLSQFINKKPNFFPYSLILFG